MIHKTDFDALLADRDRLTYELDKSRASHVARLAALEQERDQLRKTLAANAESYEMMLRQCEAERDALKAQVEHAKGFHCNCVPALRTRLEAAVRVVEAARGIDVEHCICGRCLCIADALAEYDRLKK